jgi:hypothetical protein
MTMSVYAMIFCLFFNIEKDSVPVFKYLSSQDTILIFSSDILEVSEFKTNTVYCLSDEAVKKVCAINDMNGSFYYYSINDKIWAYVQQIDYYAEYIPYGYHVTTYSGSFLMDNHCIDLGRRVPPVMYNSQGNIRQRYKRLLKKTYNDSQFIKIVNQYHSKNIKKN